MTQTTIVWLATELSSEAKQVIGQLDGFEVEWIRTLPEAAQRAAQIERGGMVLALPVAGAGPKEVLETARKANREIPIVVHDPRGELSDSGRLIRDGDFCCIFGALGPEAARVIRALVEYRTHTQVALLAGRLAADNETEPWREMLVGRCPAMQRVVELVRMIAPRQSTVLITGETGTGKEVVARAIHMASPRANRPMVAVNCSALPETLLEAELFGHVKGAFTGAVGQRIGRFEQAHQSTIFLDEIGDMPLETQCKLLRVLQEREIQRIGSTETIKVDLRVIAATNVDLAEAVGNKRFREDLYYRLRVIPIHLPPLRERTDDIPLLVERFLDKLCRKENLPRKLATSAALSHLARCAWPGNVRELEHAVELAVVLSGDRRALEPADFSAVAPAERPTPEPHMELPDGGIDFDAMMSDIQRYLLTQALEKTGGNKSRAADMLRMKRSTLVSKVKTLAAGELPLTVKDED
ncbi:MAG TPA: sigma 54-interacting transcriptional regulator [Bryobacteraceae bacterium]|nr:sigma 54-interacting transcriptional regulator [Bryobacteraceae bacterium]